MSIRSLAIIAAVAVAGSSHALGLYNYNLDNPGLTTPSVVQYLSINPQGNVDISVNMGATQTVTAGAMHFLIDGNPVSGMCVDLENNASTSAQNYNKTDYRGQIGWLIHQLPGANTNDLAAGLQVAIWEIAYDHAGGNSPVNANLAAGNFRVMNASAGIMTAATNYLAGVGIGNLLEYRRFHSDQYQDYIVAVPEPGTILGLAFGAAALVARRRQRKA